jgi:divalent metal cation (Fe/Co/Zn/Cd) transporter
MKEIKKELNKKNRLLKLALYLSIITIAYNIVEGLISLYFGLEDETLALFGFGVDSFVEVISGIGVLHMVIRMKKSDVTNHDKFEKTALRITGTAFYILAIGLIVGAIINIYYGIKPSTTLVGIIISSISIITMYALMKTKLKVGKELDSEAIIADANCTKACFYLSFILLASSGLYEIFGIAYFDIVGALGISYFAYKEGREAFQKAKSSGVSCCDSCH